MVDVAEHVLDRRRAGVDGLSATAGLAPAARICCRVRCRCGQASTWTAMRVGARLGEVARRSARARRSSGARRAAARSRACTASTTSGPMVRLGTKRPSITSTWMQSAPARLDGAHLLGEAAEVGGEDRGGDEDASWAASCVQVGSGHGEARGEEAVGVVAVRAGCAGRRRAPARARARAARPPARRRTRGPWRARLRRAAASPSSGSSVQTRVDERAAGPQVAHAGSSASARCSAASRRGRLGARGSAARGGAAACPGPSRARRRARGRRSARARGIGREASARARVMRSVEPEPALASSLELARACARGRRRRQTSPSARLLGEVAGLAARRRAGVEHRASPGLARRAAPTSCAASSCTCQQAPRGRPSVLDAARRSRATIPTGENGGRLRRRRPTSRSAAEQLVAGRASRC